MPLVSARSIIQTYYPVERDDHFIMIVSSEGNQALYDKYAENVGKDVIARMKNCMKFSPLEDSCGDVIGTEVCQVV